MALIPSTETRASIFLQANPGADGRGIIVGVMDTGVDPADGLQVTSWDAPKIIDSIDCSGTGDVDMAVIPLQGGHSLTVNGKTFTLPAGRVYTEIRHGSKWGYEVLPSTLVDRMKTERKKAFDRDATDLLASAETRLAQHIAAHGATDAALTGEHKLARAEARAAVAQLLDLSAGYADAGPLYDVIAARAEDGVWRAAVDVAGNGELADPALWLTTYRAEPGRFGNFGPVWNCNFNVNIREDGSVVSIVVCSGAHGTHVAGIIGAYFPDTPAANGVAPGCQIVNLRISDGRLASMETAPAMVRAVEAAVAAGCHVVNMSFGESIAVPNTGRVIDALRRMVQRHGIAFVASAGNEGPGLSTVGAPGGTSSFAIGVGAYVSPSMMDAQYAVRAPLPETMFTWSSTGPAADGDAGVSLVCPGGAIAPVPSYELEAKMQMNGTSMSSPEAAGCVALILSGLAAAGLPRPPVAMLKRALMNSARPVPGVSSLVQGAGLLQVDRAFALLRRWLQPPFAGSQPRAISYGVSVGPSAARGVYLRNLAETSRAYEVAVSITPEFHEDETAAARTAFTVTLALRATVPWIRVAPSLYLSAAERSVAISVAAQSLGHGLHIAGIEAFDAAGGPDDGPLFVIPVTVAVPLDTAPTEFRYAEDGLRFAPNTIHRRFFDVPRGACFVTVTLRARQFEAVGARIFWFHVMQLSPQRRYNDRSRERMLRMESGSQHQAAFAVEEGRSVEVTLAQYWSSLGESVLDLELEFSGFAVEDSARILVHSAERFRTIEVANWLAPRACTPKASLDRLQRALAPASAELAPMHARETTADQRVYALRLRYSLTLKKDAEVQARISLACDNLYEGPFVGQLAVFYDANNAPLGTRDAWPAWLRLPAGTASVAIELRHTSLSVLEGLRTVPLVLLSKLAAPITLDVYGSLAALLAAGDKATSIMLRTGDRAALFIAAAPLGAGADDGAVAGDVLVGSLALLDPPGKVASTSPKARPSMQLNCIVAAAPAAAALAAAAPAAGPAAGSSAAVSVSARLAEKLRDASMALLASLPVTPVAAAADYFTLFADLAAAHPSHVPLFAGHLDRLDDALPREARTRETLTAVATAAQSVLALIDQRAVAEALGRPGPVEPTAAKKEALETKGVLVDALVRRARALTEIAAASRADADVAAATAAANEASEWTDKTHKLYAELSLLQDLLHGRLATALADARKAAAAESPAKASSIARVAEILALLGWRCWEANVRDGMRSKFRSAPPGH